MTYKVSLVAKPQYIIVQANNKKEAEAIASEDYQVEFEKVNASKIEHI